jgi:hypothetical protein
MTTPTDFRVDHTSDRHFIAVTTDRTFILYVTRRGSNTVRASSFRNAVREIDTPVALAAVPIAIRRVAYAHFLARSTKLVISSRRG